MAAAARSAAQPPTRTAPAAFSIAVPLKKSGLLPVHGRVGLVKTKAQKSPNISKGNISPQLEPKSRATNGS
jgi:hypothetical protein